MNNKPEALLHERQMDIPVTDHIDFMSLNRPPIRFTCTLYKENTLVLLALKVAISFSEKKQQQKTTRVLLAPTDCVTSQGSDFTRERKIFTKNP